MLVATFRPVGLLQVCVYLSYKSSDFAFNSFQHLQIIKTLILIMWTMKCTQVSALTNTLNCELKLLLLQLHKASL